MDYFDDYSEAREDARAEALADARRDGEIERADEGCADPQDAPAFGARS